MAENTKSTAQADKLNGLFVRGVVMSSAAKVHKRKDGTGVFVSCGMKLRYNLVWRCGKRSTTPRTAR